MRRRTIHRALNDIPGISCVEPAGAFYAFPNVSGTGIPAKTLEVELLEKAGVATIAGTSFGRFGEGYLRLSYANSQENIRAALERIAGYLADQEARSA
jgi:aspartate/methionine/tyrosine aminotransferase